MEEDLKLLTKKSVADILGKSVRSVDRMVASGKLSIVLVEGSVRIKLSEVKNYIERNTIRNGVLAS